jgi:hypothetical protein
MESFQLSFGGGRAAGDETREHTTPQVWGRTRDANEPSAGWPIVQQPIYCSHPDASKLDDSRSDSGVTLAARRGSSVSGNARARSSARRGVSMTVSTWSDQDPCCGPSAARRSALCTGETKTSTLIAANLRVVWYMSKGALASRYVMNSE